MKSVISIISVLVCLSIVPTVFAATTNEGSFEFSDGSEVFYAFENGEVNDMTIDFDTKSLIISIDAYGPGSLGIAFSKDILDAKYGSQDAELFVLINGEQVTFSEERKSYSISIGLDILGTDTEVEIIGTHVLSQQTTPFENTVQNTLNLYVEPLPSWADYASNVMYDSTKAWEDANPDMKFYQVDSQEDADVIVQWVKEFGVEHVGFALGTIFIEVGLGDSNCLDEWMPFSDDYITHIMTHEIGHILGLEHDNDPNSIMYPVSLNLEYGIEETEYVLASNYYTFVPTCSIKDVTNYSFDVQTSDPSYGFDLYFIPSIEDFEKYDAGESFEYYADNNCYAKNVLKFSDTCEGVGVGSGLLIIMPEQSTDPLIDVSVKMQEVPYRQDTSVIVQTPKPPKVFEPVYSGTLSGQYNVFESTRFDFSIEYPSNWIVDDEVIEDEFGYSIVGFTPDGDYANSIYVTYGPEEPDRVGLTGNSYLHSMKESLRNWCSIADYEYDGFICDSFSAMNTKRISINGLDAYQIEYTYRKQTTVCILVH